MVSATKGGSCSTFIENNYVRLRNCNEMLVYTPSNLLICYLLGIIVHAQPTYLLGIIVHAQAINICYMSLLKTLAQKSWSWSGVKYLLHALAHFILQRSLIKCTLML